MTETTALIETRTSLPSVFTARPEARKRLRDFFSSHIRNRNTRRAYMEAVRQFSAFCIQRGIGDLSQVEPVHVAAFVEDQLREHSRPTVKQHLAALRQKSADSYTPVQTLPTQRGARTLALDTATGTIYLVTASFGPRPAPTAASPHPRPAMVPGSFVVLKVIASH